jgi:hypothetical protein
MESNIGSSYVVTCITQHHGAFIWHVTRAETREVMWPGSGEDEEESEEELSCEPAGHGEIATGSVTSYSCYGGPFSVVLC